MKFFTTSLTSGTFVVAAAQGASLISVQPGSSSSCTIIGGIAYNGVPSSAITRSDNNAITLTSASAFSPLDGITITHISGTIDILVGF